MSIELLEKINGKFFSYQEMVDGLLKKAEDLVSTQPVISRRILETLAKTDSLAIETMLSMVQQKSAGEFIRCQEAETLIKEAFKNHVLENNSR